MVYNANIDKQIKTAEDKWTYSPVAKIRLNSPFSHKASIKLCNYCRNISLETPLSSLLIPKDNSCLLCQILSKRLKEARNDELEMPLLEARQYIRICAVAGM